MAIENKAEVIAAILADISLGTLVSDACRKGGISRDTLNAWTKDDKELSDSYARAREMQCHALAEDALRVSDGHDEEAEARLKAMVSAIEDADDDDQDRILQSLQTVAVQRDRLRVDTRKWLVSKIAPRLYGEKLEVSGPDGGPVPVAIVGWQFGDRRIDFPSG
jgi:hypothetical protein